MRKRFFLLVPAILLVAGSVWASGFRVPEQSAVAMGMGNAWVAQADDPSAIFMNPAGIVQMDRPAFTTGITIITPAVTHKDLEGEESEVVEKYFYTPNLFATCPMGSKRWAFGIGVSTPFGLGTKWDDDSFARYSSTLTEIKLVNVNPTLAFKVDDKFSVGVGADYYRSTVIMNKKIPWGANTYLYWLGRGTNNPAYLGIPDGGFRLKGDGDGWGWNAGALWKPADNYSFGIAYRSPVKVEYEGEAILSNIGGIGVPLYGGTQLSVHGTASIEYPAIVQAGMAIKVTPALLLEADLEWTNWRSYDKLALNLEDPLGPRVSDKDWKDTITFRFGLNYKLNEKTDLRGGYIFDVSPVRDEHYDTMLPDGKNRHGLTLGFGYAFGRFSLDASYLALLQTKRDIVNNNPDLAGPAPFAPYDPDLGGTDIRGTYEGFTQLLALQLSYLF